MQIRDRVVSYTTSSGSNKASTELASLDMGTLWYTLPVVRYGKEDTISLA